MMTTPFNPKRDSGGIGERDREGVFGACAIACVAIIGIALMLLPAPVMMGEAKATGTAQPVAGSGSAVAKKKSPPPGEAPPSPREDAGRGRGSGAGASGDGSMAALGEVLGDVAAVGLPPGTQVEIVDLGSVTTTESGSGVGAGASTVGGTISDDFTGSPPGVALANGAESTGGDAKRKVKAEAFMPPDGSGTVALIVAGVLCILLGAGAGFGLKKFVPAVVLGVLGAAFIAVAFFPMLSVFVVVGGIVVLAGVYLMSEQGKKKFLESTRALTAAIDHPDVPVDAKERIAGTLAMEADTQDKKTIAMVRAKDAPLAFAGTG